MFRAIISPILRSTRLWYNAPTMLPADGIVGSPVEHMFAYSAAHLQRATE